MSSPRIILLAHGSSDKRWCETFEKLAAPTLASVDNARVGYMELAEPSIDTIIMDSRNFCREQPGPEATARPSPDRKSIAFPDWTATRNQSPQAARASEHHWRQRSERR